MSRSLKFILISVGMLLLLALIATFNRNGLFGIIIGSRPNTCPTLQMPVDLSKVSTVLYPGQYRGGDYKQHGGFGFYGKVPTNELVVKAPIGSKLTAAGRYMEQDEVQNILYFKTDCGLDYRFDHLLTLAPKFQRIMDKQPEAKISSSNYYAVRPAVNVEAGEVIASAVGFRKGPPGSPPGPNISFDFGVYNNSKGLCWLDLLPKDDADKLRVLPGGDYKSGKQSDYCH